MCIYNIKLKKFKKKYLNPEGNAIQISYILNILQLLSHKNNYNYLADVLKYNIKITSDSEKSGSDKNSNKENLIISPEIKMLKYNHYTEYDEQYISIKNFNEFFNKSIHIRSIKKHKELLKLNPYLFR